MKTFKNLLKKVEEATEPVMVARVAPVTGEDRFVAKHGLRLHDDPVNKGKAHKAKTKTKKRLADPVSDESLYEDEKKMAVAVSKEIEGQKAQSKVDILKNNMKKKTEFQEKYGNKWQSMMLAKATRQSIVESSPNPDHMVSVSKRMRQMGANAPILAKDADGSFYLNFKNGRPPVGPLTDMKQVLDALNDPKLIAWIVESIINGIEMKPPLARKLALRAAYRQGEKDAQDAADGVVNPSYDLDYDSGEKEAHAAGYQAWSDASVTTTLDVVECFSMISEAVIDDLKNIVKRKSMKTVKFANGETLPVDMTTANIIVQVHDALNSANQKKFANALDKSEASFLKMMDFSFSKLG